MLNLRLAIRAIHRVRVCLRVGFRGVYPELVEDDAILDHGTQRTQEPGDGRNEVFWLLLIAEDAQAIGQVAS